MATEIKSVGVIGLGYVGLPLVIDFCETGIKKKGALVDYYDPHIPMISGPRKYREMGKNSVSLTEDLLRAADGVVIITDHDCLDYNWILHNSALVIDTRNVLKSRESEKLVKA